jgi:hypothetical protein
MNVDNFSFFDLSFWTLIGICAGVLLLIVILVVICCCCRKCCCKQNAKTHNRNNYSRNSNYKPSSPETYQPSSPDPCQSENHHGPDWNQTLCVKLVYDFRAQNNKPLLAFNPRLVDISLSHTQNMLRTCNLSHDGFD